MANSPVKFIKITRDELVALPIKEGQLIFVTDTSKLYLDETDNSRIQIDGKDFSYGLTISGNTIGIQKDGGSSSINIPESIPAAQKGANNGVAELDSGGKVPSSQLPSYVDDVLEYASLSQFPATGESGKIYVALDTNKTYRWSGSAYVNIASDLALGETSATAYRGDRGKIAYDHSQSTHAPIDAQENIIETIKVNGESLKPDEEKAVDITIPAAAESVHLVNTNSSSVPFVLSDIEPGIYIFPDQQIYLKAKTTNTTSYSFKSIDRSIVVTGMVTTSLRSNSILCVGTNTNGIGICLAYDNTSGDVGSGLTAIACTSSIVNTGNSQTISGKKTFSTLPESSVVPTTDNQLVNKKYVDDNTGGGGDVVHLGEITEFNTSAKAIKLNDLITNTIYYFDNHDLYRGNTTVYFSMDINNNGTITTTTASVLVPTCSSPVYFTFNTDFNQPSSIQYFGEMWLLRDNQVLLSTFTLSTFGSLSISNGFLTFPLVNTSQSQTISGKKTFSTLPESSVVPTTDNQLVNKKYVDDNAYVLPAAAQTTLGGVKMYVDENNILQITTN